MPTRSWKDLVDKAQSLCLRQMPETVQLNFKADTDAHPDDQEIREGEHYFGLTLNEIRLQYGQEFHVTFDPLVYFAVDFKYGSQRVTVPRLIGPSVLEPMIMKGKSKLPHGFVIRDIRVTGPHPYRGEPVGLTVVLFKVRHTDYAKRVLAFAEKLSSVIGFPADLSLAFKIGEPVIDAIEALFDMNDSVPLLGRRFEFAASPRYGFQPQYVALVNSGAHALPPLQVKDGSLAQPSGENFADRDYVLFHLWGTDSFSSDAGMPHAPLVQKMNECAMAGDTESWQRGKSLLVSLYQQLLTNIDLTERDAERLFDEYKAGFIKNRKRSEDIRLLAHQAAPSPVAQRRAMEIARLNENARKILALPD